MTIHRSKAKALFASAPLLAAALGLALAPAPAARAQAPAQAHAETAHQAEKAVVPFVMLPTNHMLVKTKLNGKGPYYLIFDLGAPVTLLTDRASTTSGVVKDDAPRAFLFGMRGEAEIGELSAGPLKVKKLPAIVFDHPTVKALGDLSGRRIDGIMGFTLFARYKTTIDYQARTMTFEPVDFEVGDLMRDLQSRMLGPKVARRTVRAPLGLWGLRFGRARRADADTVAGVTIESVAAGSPADRAGLKPGDLLTTLDGRWTTTRDDARVAASGVPPGRETEAVVVRDGETITLHVKPAEGA